ncbi:MULTISPECIES: SDR family NAD(P)-dependent oxidoreductase [unclassified Streptomyces]|uniref:SDR family NAD(P)-dependent oxidoreductase n=1 Tax=unclassified Streptomyces TaxID=2593676 RepID=UPI00190CAD64|nr:MULTISPECIES: glucose 1-dehydrogenase [unclassified Streptomyces]MBK3564416.1 glucose 1-dehydrogenase [Streptomyces sp. MBT62]MBK6015024.1 glucose 1-dehydrogenase [Streptomyces sp. MBT53]
MKRLVTVVTGGSRGIGAATCLRLAEDGHDVVVGYLRDAKAAEQVADRVRQSGVRAVCVGADTSVEADVERLFTSAEQQLGPVTGLVNNAGVTGPFGRLADIDTADLRQIVEVNLLGTLLCSRRAAQTMTARGNGVIVNVSSSAATLGSPGDYVHYAATKAAVDTLTMGLAKELGPDGIRVNAVAPGIVDTEIHARMGDPDRARRVSASIPLRRPGQPEEIAAAIAWLMSPDASYTTGTVVRVSGGR